MNDDKTLVGTLEPLLIPDLTSGENGNAENKTLPKLTTIKKQHEQLPQIDIYLEAIKAREQNLRDVMGIAIQRGIVQQRGAHYYFKNHYLGNGDHGFYWKLMKGDQQAYQIEAEIRVAVRESMESPTPALPETIEQAINEGWRYAGVCGEAATFERSTARGFCELIKDSISGVIEVPFVARIQHGTPRRRSK